MSTSTAERFKKAYKEAYGIKPNEVNAQNTQRTDFYKSFLWRLFLGSVKLDLPLKWSIDFFRAVLFWGGGIAITELDGAIVPFSYSVKTRNKWHYPVTVEATGELATEIGERTIGEDCELIYLDSADYPNGAYAVGIASYIEIYAEKLANCDGAIDVNLMVSRTPYIFGVEDEKGVEDMKALVNRIMSGAPAIYYKFGRKANKTPQTKDLPLLKTPVKENFVSLDVQIAKRTIINEFLTGIGINNANTDKKERLITSEVEANNGEILAAVSLWQDNVNRGIDRVKALFEDFFEDNPLSIEFVGLQKSSTLNGKAGEESELNRTDRGVETQNRE